MPPALGFTIWNWQVMPLLNLFVPTNVRYPFHIGLLTGYVVYDMIHYFIHHSSPTEGYFKELKVYHMKHHYRDGKVGFGVSNKLWD